MHTSAVFMIASYMQAAGAEPEAYDKENSAPAAKGRAKPAAAAAASKVFPCHRLPYAACSAAPHSQL